ncbi:MAG: alpha-amylase family glycosyl hydrolase [bacterium]
MKINFFILVFLGSMITPGVSQNTLPAWSKGAVWYQVVPERFRNANTKNDPLRERVVDKNVKDWQVHPWASDWFKFQIWESTRKAQFYDLVKDRRYGGDLIGVIEKLEYLKTLGVDVIYLNPIFESPSAIKYDAATFHHVDNNFGEDREGDWSLLSSQQEDPERWETTSSDETFFDLLKSAHDADMKVVLEAAFSYCGRDFWAFKDLLEKQQDSPYKEWFEVLCWDNPVTIDTSEFTYKSWQNDRNLPCFKQDENGLVAPVNKYIFDSTRKWMDPNGDGEPQDGIDGWCVTAAEELDLAFWQEWADTVKSINPLALTVLNSSSKTFHASTESPFDVFINYAFKNSIEKFFVQPEMSVTEFDKSMASLRAESGETGLSLLNLIGSYNSARIESRIFNSSKNFTNGSNSYQEKAYDPRKPDKADRQTHKLIAIFQMTYPGSPLIYYGDESGMWGGPNPDNLKPMLWSEFVTEKETYWNVRKGLRGESENTFDATLFSLYAKLNYLRHKNPAIRHGNFKTYLVDDKRRLFAYLRQFENNEALVVLNNSDQRQTVEIASVWEKGTKVKDVLNNQKYSITNKPIKIELGKKWGALLVHTK